MYTLLLVYSRSSSCTFLHVNVWEFSVLSFIPFKWMNYVANWLKTPLEMRSSIMIHGRSFLRNGGVKFSIVREKGDDNGEDVTWDRDEQQRFRAQWKWNPKRAVSVTQVLSRYPRDTLASQQPLSLFEKSILISYSVTFLLREADTRRKHAGWSMENLIWTQWPDRSGANEVGFPDGRSDRDGGEIRIYADTIGRPIHEVHTCAVVQGWKIHRKKKKKSKSEELLDGRIYILLLCIPIILFLYIMLICSPPIIYFIINLYKQSHNKVKECYNSHQKIQILETKEHCENINCTYNVRNNVQITRKILTMCLMKTR